MPSTLTAPAAPVGAPSQLRVAPGQRRLPGLDRLRGLALLMMLVHHFTGWLTDRPRDVLVGLDGFALTHVAAPAFAITAGASLALLVGRSQRKGMSQGDLTRMVLRRYGLLVPIGILLGFVALSNPFYFSVLDALGFGALVAFAVLSLVPQAWARWGITSAFFAASLPVLQWGETLPTSYVVKAMSGKFPLLEYAAFTLVGALVVERVGNWDRRKLATAAAAGTAVIATMLVTGVAPQRYPGGFRFIVPGVAGTLVLYALVTSWRRPPALLERSVVVAGQRSLGIFVSHYALYVVLDRTGVAKVFSPGTAMAIALTLTVLVVAAALRLPPLPFSLRKGSAAEVRPQELDRVAPDDVAVLGAVTVARQHDEVVLDLRDR